MKWSFGKHTAMILRNLKPLKLKCVVSINMMEG
ncbi:hypothetical protein [Salmonella phage vB_SenM-S16]|uniref:Uncharacterized protein n=1 Tax=Salmonella phage S16 TaxID=1087482 RepID=M1H979_BPS16|nr:hypothetical protein I133_gp145 [Salmonella phage vB_SenM-S16]AGE48184.1 hypothetical protein [Salmonella phage vB_SenM-S16]